MSTTGIDPRQVLSEVNASNRFLVQQVFKPIGNEYRISIPAPGSSDEGRPLLFVKQKKLKIKEDIRFRLDPDREEHLFMIKAKTVFEFRGRHEVLDADGQVIGMIEKDFAKSLLRSHWHVRDAGGSELFEARVADMLPDFLAALTWLPFNFVFMRDGTQVGTYRRVLGKLRDRYVLELGESIGDADRRVVLAFAVALDALQDR